MSLPPQEGREAKVIDLLSLPLAQGQAFDQAPVVAAPGRESLSYADLALLVGDIKCRLRELRIRQAD